MQIRKGWFLTCHRRMVPHKGSHERLREDERLAGGSGMAMRKESKRIGSE